VARVIIMQIRLSVDEHDLIFRLASREGMNASEFVRETVREAARLRGIAAVGLSRVYELGLLPGAQNADQPKK